MASIQAIEQRGQMQAGRPVLFRYPCEFVSVLWHSPQPSRAAQAFHACLLDAHGSPAK